MDNKTTKAPKYLSFFKTPKSYSEFEKRYNIGHWDGKNVIDKLLIGKHLRILRNQCYVVSENFEIYESELLINELRKLHQIIKKGMLFYGGTFETKQDAENWLEKRHYERDVAEGILVSFLRKDFRGPLLEHVKNYYEKTKTDNEEFSLDILIQTYKLDKSKLSEEESKIKFLSFFSKPKTIEEFISTKSNKVNDITEAKNILDYLTLAGHLNKIGNLYINKEKAVKFLIEDLEPQIIKKLDEHFDNNNKDMLSTALQLTKLETKLMKLIKDGNIINHYNKMIRSNHFIDGEFVKRKTIHIMNIENRRDEWKKIKNSK